MKNKIIAYQTQTQAQHTDAGPAEEMGALRRGLWLYSHKLGLEHTLVLAASLVIQALIALLIGIHGMSSVPGLSSLMQSDSPPIKIGATILCLIFWVIIQTILVAELAQVVWLQQPDKLKVRLQSDSFWWWIMLVCLVLTTGLDFILLFFGLTNAVNFGAAWAVAVRNQLSIFTTGLLLIISFLTLLRCASVMRTSTTEENRRAVEARLVTQSEEILLNAGDATKRAAAQVWRTLAIDPAQLVPLQNSVLNLIAKQHPEIANIGGNTWAYDFSGNTLAAIPPDVHFALNQHRARLVNKNGIDRLSAPDSEQLWNLPPTHLAETIGYNMETYGQPNIIDVTDPTTPRYNTQPVTLPSSRQLAAGNVELGNNKPSVLEGLSKRQLQEFKLYMLPIYEKSFGQSFISENGDKVFDYFEDYQLRTYLDSWQQGVRV